ncbi:glycogen/starch/alpha-glucan phosphorylase [Paenibacillus woosongensis]|uniref:Alpha-1,4 glucan phosphorylase n=1 Tax=Paenibacillus woosongensis TaxID=307580 RepID=A0A7X2YZS4_9BACL|nr:glycogen/starch/alpha-glucan phosphorylase [Paenibacillus woosongensis]MUG44795.1 glycogen/starch/alpha-glucan family phosphorylase [Paenibacillus woosongensis]
MFDTKENFKEAFKKELVMQLGKPVSQATDADVYRILGMMIRERIGEDWANTNQKLKAAKAKQVYYFSMEFLIGRQLGNNLLSLGVLELVRDGLQELGFDLDSAEEEESDPGLGNGGLGRLAACFLDSLAAQQLPGHGCGIRYRYGLFEQKIVDGHQVELPDYWLQRGNVWEVCREDKKVEVRFGGEVQMMEKDGRLHFELAGYESIWAIPYDIPVIGSGSSHVNTLRLWSARPAKTPIKPNNGSYYNYLNYYRSVESVSEFLYPDDSEFEGKLLRLKQQYFLCSAGLQSILRTFDKLELSIECLPDKAAIHINDTHPTLVIPELMRILLDERGCSWEQAWQITRRAVSYTNHTTLNEALEKWPAVMVKQLLPRIYMIIEEMNKRFCAELLERYPGDQNRISQLAIVFGDQIRMANLAIAGSYSVNGVAALHTEILKKREMKAFYELYPERFNNKTNGISHRRWLMHANPELAKLITEAIGSRWYRQPREMIGLIKYAEDRGFQDNLHEIKRGNKLRLAKYVREKLHISIDPDSIFDVQAKRLHAYKRQLLNVLHMMHLYNQLKDNPSADITPRTFLFSAKAAPGYYLAKNIIKLINTVADTVNRDRTVRDKMKVVFLENYSVSLAEKLIPAADVSEQISTAGKEASGTGNMKFMMNGALTVGTLDGANVEMHEMLGDDNMFLFGLRAEQVMEYNQSGEYSPWHIYDVDLRVKEVMDQLIQPGRFCPEGQDFESIYQSVLHHQDEFFVLKDFASYVEAHLRIDLAYRNARDWLKKSALNIAHSGKFSSDHTIKQYATGIWQIEPLMLQRKK